MLSLTVQARGVTLQSRAECDPQTSKRTFGVTGGGARARDLPLATRSLADGRQARRFAASHEKGNCQLDSRFRPKL